MMRYVRYGVYGIIIAVMVPAVVVVVFFGKIFWWDDYKYTLAMNTVAIALVKSDPQICNQIRSPAVVGSFAGRGYRMSKEACRQLVAAQLYGPDECAKAKDPSDQSTCSYTIDYARQLAEGSAESLKKDIDQNIKESFPFTYLNQSIEMTLAYVQKAKTMGIDVCEMEAKIKPLLEIAKSRGWQPGL